MFAMLGIPKIMNKMELVHERITDIKLAIYPKKKNNLWNQ